MNRQAVARRFWLNPIRFYGSLKLLAGRCHTHRDASPSMRDDFRSPDELSGTRPPSVARLSNGGVDAGHSGVGALSARASAYVARVERGLTAMEISPVARRDVRKDNCRRAWNFGRSAPPHGKRRPFRGAPPVICPVAPTGGGVRDRAGGAPGHEAGHRGVEHGVGSGQSGGSRPGTLRRAGRDAGSGAASGAGGGGRTPDARAAPGRDPLGLQQVKDPCGAGDGVPGCDDNRGTR